MESDVFRTFCYYVDEHIFSKENLGSYVALVVDQSFIDDFCKENHTTEGALMHDVRKTLCCYCRDHLTIKGIVAIQLFAATKRANAEGYTAKNYYNRLSQVINWSIDDLYRWMKENQEDVWLSLYNSLSASYWDRAICTISYPTSFEGFY